MTPKVVLIQKRVLGVILPFVSNCSIGGFSNVRTTQQRLATLSNDQLMGQLGEAALSHWFTGSLKAYIEARKAKDLDPLMGDNGRDLLDWPVDVKTTHAHCKLKDGSPLPLEAYRLIIPQREFHQNLVYILALVKKKKDHFRVNLMGWATSQTPGLILNTGGDFRGKWCLPATALEPMETCKDAIRRIRAKSDGS